MRFNTKFSNSRDIQTIEVENLDQAFLSVRDHLTSNGDSAHVWAGEGKYVHVMTRNDGEANHVFPDFSFNNYPIECLNTPTKKMFVVVGRPAGADDDSVFSVSAIDGVEAASLAKVEMERDIDDDAADLWGGLANATIISSVIELNHFLAQTIHKSV